MTMKVGRKKGSLIDCKECNGSGRIAGLVECSNCKGLGYRKVQKEVKTKWVSK